MYFSVSHLRLGHKALPAIGMHEDMIEVILRLSSQVWMTIRIGDMMEQEVFHPSLASLAEILRKGRQWNKNRNICLVLWVFLLRVYYSVYTLM